MAGLILYCGRYHTSFLVFFRRELHLPKVLRNDTLMYIVKGEEGVVIVYMLKWQ